MDKWRWQADSARKTGLESTIQAVLSVVESGGRRGRIKTGGLLGDLGALFLHLEMSGQSAGTQALGKYCRSVS